MIHWWIKEYIFCDSWLKFEFKIPIEVVLELTEKHFRWSDHISWQAIGIWPRLHLFGQRMIHWLLSTSIFPNVTLEVPIWEFSWNVCFLYFHQFYLHFEWTINAYPQLSIFYTDTSYKSQKNSAYGRHQLSRPMRIVGPIQIWRGCMIYKNKFKKINKKKIKKIKKN